MSRKIEVDTKTFVRFWLVILGFGALGWFIWRARAGLLIVLIAVFLAIALKPLANQIDNIDKAKKRKSLAAVLSVVSVVAIILLVIGLVGPVVVNETARFIGQAPEEIAKVMNGPEVDKIGQALGITDLKTQVLEATRGFSAEMVKNLSNFAFSSVTTIAQILTGTILVVVLTILTMLQGPKLMDGVWKMLAARNSKAAKVVEQIASKMTEVISKYVSGQLLIALLDGVVVAVIIVILSLIFGFSAGLAIPMGLMAMILYLIPMFGPIIAAGAITLIMTVSSPLAGLAFLIVYMIYAQVENNAIAPKIQGKGMDLPPLLILVAITIGMYAFGLIGTIVAVPIAGCIKVLIDEYPKLKELG